MAAKMKRNDQSLRKISKPVISTDVMGNRNVEVRAVGAWVQAEPQPFQQEAVLAAREEEQRLHQMQVEKQARLKHFQQEVKKRVQRLDRLKKQEQLEKNCVAAEQERHIVCQSAFSSQDYAKKDNCVVRPNTTLTVEKLHQSKSDGYLHDKGNLRDSQAFSDQTNQVHQFVKQAKKSLVSRRVDTDKLVVDDLPGGVWKVSKTRDVSDDNEHPSSRYTVDGEEFDLLDDDLIEKVKIINNKEYEGDKENVEEEQTRTVQFDLDQKHQFDLEEKGQGDMEPLPKSQSQFRERRPHSAHAYCKTDTSRAGMPGKVLNIYEGVQSEEEKRRAKSQQAMYRRLFMDIEREQVKETLRRQEHRKRIQKLKKEKELERVREEQISQQLTEPRDPVTGETSVEALEREEQERRFVRETVREHERKVRKMREMERYIEALRQQLKEKVRRKKVDLPPLCCCGESVWDTNPETCANNCIFYKNPKEYGRALQAMLDSSDLM